jgi:hypothetical protein
MKLLPALAIAVGAAGVAHSNPLVIEESSTIQPPPGIPGLSSNTGLDGNEAVVIGIESIPDPEGADDTRASAYLYRRNGTSWSVVRKLAERYEGNEMDVDPKYPVAMRGGVIKLNMGAFVFERENGNWVQKPIVVGGGGGGGGCGDAELRDIEIYGGRIFSGGDSWGGGIVEKNAATGEWRFGASLRADCSGDGDQAVGAHVDISQNWAAVASPYNWDGLPAPAVHIFQRSGTSWPLHTRLVIPAGHDLGDVAIRDTELFIGDIARFGTSVWRRDSAGQWAIADSLRTAGDFNVLRGMDGAYDDDYLEKDEQYVLRMQRNEDRGVKVVNVFRPDSSGSYRHLAMLVAKDGGDLYGAISISGRGVLVGTRYFELPTSFTQPSLLQDTFAMGNGAGWSYLPGSQFSVVQSGSTRVFRQTSTAGEAGAVFDAADWTHQAIQAEVKPTAINGSNRWVGLATRRTDASNYYYVTLRSSGVIELKRNVGGVFGTLDRANLPWALNRIYRLRLESVGTLHRVYVNGELALEARDGALTRGRAALLSYRVAADYDNVIVSPFATQTIYSASGGTIYTPPRPQPEPWAYSGQGTWQWERVEPTPETANELFRQISTAGDARAVIGPERIPNTDQIVEARVRPRSFASAGDPWFGVMARFQDTSNYVYMSLRRSNTLTLRKVVDGSIVQLGSAPVTVAPNSWYSLRLEAVGSQLRAYVNGRQVLEATDSQPSNGRVGLVTFRTAADYDDIRAVAP